ncbi:MAG TPA: hypothetical protein VLA81_07460, partial [Burkholderiales bacterium]|nr:hypothetical protein [Burkholderiales bacterium]
MADQKAQPGPRAFDASQLASLYSDIAGKSARLVTQFLERSRNGMPGVADELGIAQAFFEAWAKLLADPFKLAEAQMKLWQDHVSLWQRSMLKLMGQETTPIAEPHQGDRRFKHEDWKENFLYDYIKQSYLIAARHLHQTLGRVEGLDGQTSKKVDFYTRQYID